MNGRPWVLLVLIGVVGGAAACINAVAAEPKAEPFRVTGVVGATTADDGTIQAVELKADDGATYKVTLDPNGRDLAAMAGEKTRVTGALVKKPDATWLTVQAFENLELVAAHEQWRRMRCNWCVVAPAEVNATVPPDLRGAVPIDGRPFSYKGTIAAWTRDSRSLWVATDNELFQIDLAGKRLVRSYTVKNGLPDQVVYGLLSDGKVVRMVHQGGLAELAIGGDRITQTVACNFGRLAAGEEGAWLLADTGTFALKGLGEFTKHQPAPTAEQMTKTVRNGIWLPYWNRKTEHFFASPVVIGKRLYVASYGDVYEFDGTRWAKVAQNGWNLRAAGGRLWFLSPRGVGEHDPATGKLTMHSAPTVPDGNYRRLLATESAVWAAAEPRVTPQGLVGGGLARFDLAAAKWQTWSEVNGHRVERVTCLEPADGAVWVFNVEGQYQVKAAHPGMTYVKQKVFDASGLCVHRFTEKEGKWETMPLGLPAFEKRLVLGQDGERGHDVVVPQAAEAMSVNAARVFGVLELFPKLYFCGYYPSVEQLLARGAEGAWAPKFQHQPDLLGLQGEHPLVLNISNTGQFVSEAVGHDNVLALFLHGGEHWAVTEGRVSRFDEKQARWETVIEPGFRFYWRPTAALDDGHALYVGSDRGLVARLDFDSGRFERLLCLDQRSISRIVNDDAGNLLVGTEPSPLGMLPVSLRGRLDAKDWAAARFDGKSWAQIDPTALPRAAAPAWFIRMIQKRHRWDKSEGNFLFGPTPQGPKPRFYVKGVFFPKFLCVGADGDRLWLSTQNGLLRLDNVKKALEAAK